MQDIPFLYGELNKRVTPIEYSIVARKTKDDFPKTGEEDKLYVSTNERAIYIWDSSIDDYVAASDLSNYYNKEEVDEKIKNVEVDLTGYATETYVDDAIAAIPKPDLTDYATEDYVNDAVGAIEFPEVDLGGYATEQYVETAITNAFASIGIAEEGEF